MFDRMDHVTVRTDPDYVGYVADADGDIRIVLHPEATIPSAGGPSSIQETFTVLLDIWGSNEARVEPDLLYIDFGDTEGFAAVKLSEEGWKLLRAIGYEETTVEALESNPLLAMDQLRHDRDLWRTEALRLREGGRPWKIDRDDVATHLDTDEGPKHIVAALFKYAEKAKDEGNIGFEGHIMTLHAARYIQWLEDELHRYQVQPVDNEVAVEGETYERWDEDEARELAYKTEHEQIHEIQELAEHLGHAITVLDANRIWRVQADQETTRLGHWNLKLREAAEAAADLLEDRHVEKLIGDADEYEPVVKMLRSSLRSSP